MITTLLLALLNTSSTQPTLSPSLEADANYLLTTTADFMQVQFGMAITDVQERNGYLVVRTTGAEFFFQPSAGVLQLRQRIGKPRLAAEVTFPAEALNGLKVVSKGTGAVLLEARGGKLRLRINGDSLLMLKDVEPLDVRLALRFEPASSRQQGDNYLFLDEFGGVGAYAATGKPGASSAEGLAAVAYKLAAEQVLWLSVAPPKPFDWEASFHERVVWHWSTQTGYPSDAEIEEWSRYGNLLLQQAEVMLWKDWMLRFEPRFGLEEFQRVNRTCEKYGMRNYVYTSPYYFLAGTGGEGRAINSFENFQGWVPGDGRGINWPLFLAEITKVMREYKPDGLYFDGIYDNVVRTYLISRKAREVVGEDGLLEYHATWSPPGGDVYLPQIDAYYTFILRGEGAQDRYEDPDYLRYFVSTYNISNSIGVLCNNNDYRLTEEYIARLLDNNIRLHLIPGWLRDYRKEAMEKHYWPVLDNSLKARVEAAATVRTEAAREARRLLAEALGKGVDGLQVAYTEDFGQEGTLAKAEPPPADARPQVKPPAEPVYLDAPGGWRAYFSANSGGSLAVHDGMLEIRSRCNTCAYLERPLPEGTVAVECRAKCPSNGGMSWGPGIALRVGDRFLRLNARADDRIGLDRSNNQTLVDGYEADTWYWLRLRLAGDWVLSEASRDGKTWTLLRTERFNSSGNKWLLIGKIANNGTNTEYNELGPPGISYIDDLRVYVAP